MARRALGKGLDALIPDLKGGAGEGVVEIGIEEIASNPFQPRTRMSEDSLEDLKQSISERGVLQPIIVRRKAGRYELVAGERRLRAAKLAGLEKVPAIIKQVSDGEALEIALVENLQREDLNPIDEARGYKELIQRFDLTQEQLAKKIGKDRSTIANTLRLLQLPDLVRQGLEDGEISVGHARALLGLDDGHAVEQVYRMIKHRGLSVRQVEAVVRRRQREKARPRRQRQRGATDAEIDHLEESLMRRLGTRVKIIVHGNHGKIEIEFYSMDDLTRILEKIG